jgi:enoyl-CoA hydratase/carnithine racemase
MVKVVGRFVDLGVYCVTVSNASYKNQFSIEVLELLLKNLRAAIADAQVKVILFTSEGHEYFAQDADWLNMKQHAKLSEVIKCAQEITRVLETTSKPTIAVVNGSAKGIGLELALASDFIIMAPHAMLDFAYIAEGLVPACGSLVRLLNKVGLRLAKELLLLAQKISANEAKQIGLAHATDENAMQLAVTKAKMMAQFPGVALTECKQLLQNFSENPGIDYKLDFQLQSFLKLVQQKITHLQSKVIIQGEVA